jgi:hypothetical protein
MTTGFQLHGHSLAKMHPKHGVQEISVSPCTKGGAAFVSFRSGTRFIAFSLDQVELGHLISLLVEQEERAERAAGRDAAEPRQEVAAPADAEPRREFAA